MLTTKSNGLKVAVRRIQLGLKVKHPAARMADPWNRLLWEGGSITEGSHPQDEHVSRTGVAELSQGRLGGLQALISNDLLAKPI